MKSIWLPLAAIFFMTYLYRAGGGGRGHGPLGTPPGSATVNFMFFDLVLAAVSKLFVMVFDCPHHDLEKYM